MLDRVVLPSQLSAFGTALAATLLLTGYLVVGEPYVGYVLHRRFERAARAHADARRWLYRRLLVLEWGLCLLCVMVVGFAPHVGFGALGLRLPSSALGWWVSIAVVLAALVALALTARQVSAMGPNAQLPSPNESVIAMLPRSAVERRLFSIVSVTAGICEELVYRSFLLMVVAALLPGAPLWVCALLTVVVFALAHAYQGAGGVVATLIVGALLAALYLSTGSVLAAMIVHALIDLRAVWLGRLVAAGPAREVSKQGA